MGIARKARSSGPRPGESRNEARLRRAALDVSAAGGPRVFEQLAARLADLLGVRACLVALLSPDGRSARTLAAWRDGAPVANFAFDATLLPGGDDRSGFRTGAGGRPAGCLPGTPLGEPALAFHAVHPLLDAAGEPVGLLAALDDRGLDDERLAATVMNIFAARIVAEIERDRADEALRNAALAVSGAAGAAVHAELCRYLATMLDVDMAFVAEYRAERPDTLETLAVWCDGELRPDFEYPSVGTPCETIVGPMFRAYPQGLREAFPTDADFVSMGVSTTDDPHSPRRRLHVRAGRLSPCARGPRGFAPLRAR